MKIKNCKNNYYFCKKFCSILNVDGILNPPQNFGNAIFKEQVAAFETGRFRVQISNQLIDMVRYSTELLVHSELIHTIDSKLRSVPKYSCPDSGKIT